MLKIKKEHYAELERACMEVLAAYPGIEERYASHGLSSMRLNFDVLRACVFPGMNGTEYQCRVLYPYLNDDHIGSALAKIMKNDGLNSKGKR